MKTSLLPAALAVFLSLPLAAATANMPKGKSAFLAADTDGDGRISAREYVVAAKGKMNATEAKAKFAELDKNKDGSLSGEEFAVAEPRKKARTKKASS